MAITQRHSLIRRAFAVSAVAIAVTALGASSPIAAAAPVTVSPASSFKSLDNPASWAVVHEAAINGYAVPAKFAASCGATH